MQCKHVTRGFFGIVTMVLLAMFFAKQQQVPQKIENTQNEDVQQWKPIFEKEFANLFDSDRLNLQRPLQRATTYECKMRILHSYKMNTMSLYAAAENHHHAFHFPATSMCPLLHKEQQQQGEQKNNQTEKESVTRQQGQQVQQAWQKQDSEQLFDKYLHERYAAMMQHFLTNGSAMLKEYEQTSNTTVLPHHGIKLAFVVFVHNNLNHVKRLLSKIYDPSFYYVIHVDKKASIEFVNALQDHATSLMPKNKRNMFVYSKYKVNWGGWSMIEMTLDTMAKLLEMGNDWDYVINLSGADYPLKSLQEMTLHLSYVANELGTKELNYLDIRREDLQRAHQGFRMAFTECEDYIHLTSWRELPRNLEIFAGSQWWILHRSFVEWMKNDKLFVPQYMEYVKYQIVPDENFFQTVAGNSIYCDKVIRNNYRYYKWSDGIKECFFDKMADACGNHPQTLSQKQLSELQLSPQFFARKFSEKEEELVQEMDKWLQKTERHEPFGTFLIQKGEFCLTAIDDGSVHVIPCAEKDERLPEQEWIIGPCANATDLKLLRTTDNDTCLVQTSDMTMCAIVNRKYGKCLDVHGGQAYPGNSIGIFECNLFTHQLWSFGKRTNADWNRNGAACMVQSIVTRESLLPPLCMDMNEQSSHVSLWHCNHFGAQRITFVSSQF